MSKQKRTLKVGVREGGGPPPGYEWNVGLIDFVCAEAVDVVGQVGYDHLAMQVRELASQPVPSHSDTVDIRPIEDFFEIRDKGGVFGGANVRLFFGIDKATRAIVPLGVIKKQNDGQTPLGTKITMRRRWRKYRSGDYGKLSAK
ncbi:MAG: hypothetical protein WD066_12715 [Planctomycetaceae bacterium]